MLEVSSGHPKSSRVDRIHQIGLSCKSRSWVRPTQRGLSRLFHLESVEILGSNNWMSALKSWRQDSFLFDARYVQPTSKAVNPLNLWALLLCLSQSDLKTWPVIWAKSMAIEAQLGKLQWELMGVAEFQLINLTMKTCEQNTPIQHQARGCKYVFLCIYIYIYKSTEYGYKYHCSSEVYTVTILIIALQ